MSKSGVKFRAEVHFQRTSGEDSEIYRFVGDEGVFFRLHYESMSGNTLAASKVDAERKMKDSLMVVNSPVPDCKKTGRYKGKCYRRNWVVSDKYLPEMPLHKDSAAELAIRLILESVKLLVRPSMPSDLFDVSVNGGHVCKRKDAESVSSADSLGGEPAHVSQERRGDLDSNSDDASSLSLEDLFRGELESNVQPLEDESEQPLSRQPYRERTLAEFNTDEDEIVLFQRDPALLKRAWDSHTEIEQQLAEMIRKADYLPLSDGNPRLDIAWESDDTINIVEVKSISNVNEVAQLRMGLGQVLHYAAQMRKQHPDAKIRALLAVEKEPTDAEVWRDACKAANVKLIWGPEFEGLLD